MARSNPGPVAWTGQEVRAKSYEARVVFDSRTRMVPD
ncbi:hypothetical protein [Pseudomonas sp. 31 R 17]|nr:hypothetical protein [Pseudomonas sp. 31 R 17]